MRSFIAGSRLWPPASTLASLFACSSATASATVVGRWYEKLVVYIAQAPLRASRIAVQTFCGVSGMSIFTTPSGASASITAL